MDGNLGLALVVVHLEMQAVSRDVFGWEMKPL